MAYVKWHICRLWLLIVRNRTAFIALVAYADGEKRYIIAPEGLKVGSQIVSGNGVAPEVGNALTLKDVPLGTHGSHAS